MNSICLKEQEYYTKQELLNCFKCDENNGNFLIRKLKEYGILKTIKGSAKQKDLTELLDSDIEITDLEPINVSCYYVPAFVGIVAIGDIVFNFYPKYLKTELNVKPKFKQVLKVLEKYHSREQIIKIIDDPSKNSNTSILSILLFLLNDYYENGTYSYYHNITEINGVGEILWDKTVNETMAIISKNRPYYTELKTKRNINNNFNYIKRLYECILTKASQKLDEYDILDLFDITPVYLSEENIEDFGDDNYILYRLERELQTEFNTRKQLILKVLSAYINNRKCVENIECLSFYGTNSFNLVWEKVCKNVFNNNLYSSLAKLNLPKPLEEKFIQNGEKLLIDIIKKPIWTIGENKNLKTFIPDLISISNENNHFDFVILDAKYYCPQIESEQPILRQPGIEAISKQHLYELVYKDFINTHNFNSVKNIFLFPTEESNVFNKGEVFLEVFTNLNLQPIEIKFVPAETMFKCYLENKTLPVSYLWV